MPMFCGNCGTQIPDNSQFCPNCGASTGAPAGNAASQGQWQQPAQPAYQQPYQAQGQYYGQAAMQQPPQAYANSRPLKDDRSLALYIVLSIVTCGIYSWWFIHSMAEDLNVACEGDGEETPGLAQYILLSLITCGIYNIWWIYKVGNRLSANAPRYGMRFQENGTTLLMWYIVGLLVCGIGSFVAIYMMIKNMNQIARAYNSMVLGRNYS